MELENQQIYLNMISHLSEVMCQRRKIGNEEMNKETKVMMEIIRIKLFECCTQPLKKKIKWNLFIFINNPFQLYPVILSLFYQIGKNINHTKLKINN